MSQRSAFQVQILEKIGAPLMVAVSDVSARQKSGDTDTQKQDAERLAELLGKTVQAGVALAAAMDLKDSGENADSIRLALAALAGPLVAGQYRLSGKIPGDADIKRMVKALEAVLTFSDNFTPAPENIARLDKMTPGGFDENQIHIQYVNALVPVVNAVAAFPFGRPENKMMQEVADRLVATAEGLGRKMVNGAPEPAARLAGLSILHALSGLYVQCHQEQVSRLMAMDEQARAKAAEQAGGALPVDPVWQAFEMRVGMIELLGKAAVPGGSSGSAAPAPVKAEPVPASPPSPPPAPPPPPETPPAAADGESGQDTGSYNPMGFFKPKGGDEGEAA